MGMYADEIKNMWSAHNKSILFVLDKSVLVMW